MFRESTRFAIISPVRQPDGRITHFLAFEEDITEKTRITGELDRYRQRLFAYSRQMLGGSRQDAEDALQDVFLRAYSSLRSNDRPLSSCSLE